MGLQISNLIGDQAVPVGVALVEGIVSELLDDVEHLIAESRPVTGGLAAPHKGGPLLFHEFPVLFPASLPKVVRLSQGVTGELLGYPHYRLLVDHEAVGVSQNFLGIRVEVDNPLSPVFAIGVVVVHVGCHWSRSVQGD